MGAAADDQTAVVGAVGEKVDQALEAAEVRLLGVLILMRPRLVWGEVGAASISLVQAQM